MDVLLAALVFWEPGRFEVMLDAMKLKDPVIAARILWKDTLINS
jgi:hypothetical protein